MEFMRLLTIIISFFFFVSCDNFEIQPVEPNVPRPFTAPQVGQSLENFIAVNALTVQADSLIACAFSGDHGFLPTGMTGEARVLAYSYLPGVDFLYFRSTDELSAATDLSHYEFDPGNGTRPVANGFFEVLPTESPAAGDEELFIVAFVSGAKVYVSNPISVKGTDLPTASFPEELSTDLAQPRNPAFSWPDAPGDNVIFFHLLTDIDGNVVSGTYSTENTFSYYDLANVVLNVSPGTPPASLSTGNTHRMTIMGVGSNNWVNFIRDATF